MSGRIEGGAPDLRPVPGKERIEVIDVLRGLAIFGMFVVNMSHDLPWGFLFIDNRVGAPVLPAVLVLETLGKDKFFALFAFLFGLGVAIQTDRARARGAGSAAMHVRRMLALLAIGAAFTLVVPWEILISYGVVGLVLLAFRSCSARALLVSALACVVLSWGLTAADYWSRPPPQSAHLTQADVERRREVLSERLAPQTRTYATGSVVEIGRMRAASLRSRYASPAPLRAWLGSQLPLMLLGMFVWRRRVFQDLEANVGFVREVFWWGLGFGAVGMFIHRWFSHVMVGPRWPRLTDYLGEGLWGLAAPAMGFAYAAAVVLLSRREAWARRLRFLAVVGRLSFSNYLFSGFVFAFLFFGYGLGLYATLGPLAGAALAVAIFPVHVIWSTWWVRRFRFGPVEWLWRSLAYGKLQPLRM